MKKECKIRTIIDELAWLGNLISGSVMLQSKKSGRVLVSDGHYAQYSGAAMGDLHGPWTKN